VEVDDRQATVSEGDATVGEQALVVGPAMAQDRSHLLGYVSAGSSAVEPEDSRQAAHRQATAGAK
jgi:hypothetical protein